MQQFQLCLSSIGRGMRVIYFSDTNRLPTLYKQKQSVSKQMQLLKLLLPSFFGIWKLTIVLEKRHQLYLPNFKFKNLQLSSFSELNIL